MYEFTHRGAGVNWAALDQKSRRLVSGSMASALVAVMPLFKWTGDAARRVGIEFEGAMPTEGTAVSTSSLYLPAPWVVAWVIGFAALSGLLWWRMSIRQDELFHRVQNWSLGMSGAWTAAALTVWGLLDMTGISPPIQGSAPLILFSALTILFGRTAARKWAS
jgi:hypothetical protein